MLNFKKPSRAIIFAVVALVAVLCVGCVVDRAINTPLIEMEISYKDDPALFFPVVQIKWDETIYSDITIFWKNPFNRGDEIGYALDEYGTNWRIFELKGYSKDYLLIFERDNMNVFCLMHPNAPDVFKTYILENITEKQRVFDRLLSVTLYRDGTARLETPFISSYALMFPCYYSFVDGELLIHYESNNVIAKFATIDDNTLVFKEATVPLFADKGARYVSAKVKY